MVSTSSWLKSPVVTFGGTSMTLFLMLTVYSNFLLEYEKSLSNKTEEVTTMAWVETTSEESTTLLPEEFYLIANGVRLLKSECRKLIMVMAKRMIKIFNKCLKKLRKEIPDKEEFIKRFACATKCFMVDSKFIQTDGHLTNDSFMEYLDGNIPVRYHPIAWPLGGPCIQEYIDKIDPSDPYCIAYDGLLKCLQATLDENCRSPAKPPA